MSLPEVTNPGRADLVPGFILCKPGNGAISAAETTFTSRYLETMAKGCASLPRDVMLAIMQDCARDVIMQNLAYGKPGFDIWARVRSSLPLLTFLSARMKHGDKVTMEMVATWLEGPDAQRVADGVWELWGYPPETTAKKNDGESEGPDTSTGSESSSGSPNPPPKDTESPPSNSST